MPRNIRPLVNRHGGKYYLCDNINALVTSHMTSVETHVGGGSWSLNKQPSNFEIINDLDKDLINAWKCVKNYYIIMLDALRNTDYTEERWVQALADVESPDKIVRAISYIIKYRMSRSGMGVTYGWADRPRGGQPGNVNAWKTFVSEELPKIHERSKKWHMFSEDAVSRKTLFYCDPPYLQETRTDKKTYGEFEMNAGQHVGLLKALHECNAKAIVSGYRSDLYDMLLSDWKRYDIPMKNNSGQGKTKQDRIESIWIKE
jgi:DNA adenine methylase